MAVENDRLQLFFLCLLFGQKKKEIKNIQDQWETRIFCIKKKKKKGKAIKLIFKRKPESKLNTTNGFDGNYYNELDIYPFK